MHPKKHIPLLASLLATTLTLNAQVIFQDSFESGAGLNNQDINLDIGTSRQTVGRTSTYTMTGVNVIANLSTNDDGKTNNGSTSGNGMARIRNNEQDSGSTNGFLSLDTNFGTQLAGEKYTISYDLYYNQRTTSTLDQWISFAVGETDPAGSPAAAGSDFGVLLRPDGVGNVGVGDNFGRFYADGAFSAANDTTAVPSYIGGYLSFLVSIDETGVSPVATLTIGGTAVLSSFNFDFESTDRYFAFGSHLGADTVPGDGNQFADTYIDNLTITVVPEPSTYALIGGLLALTSVMIRRRN